MDKEKQNILIFDLPNEYTERYTSVLSAKFNVTNVLTASKAIDCLSQSSFSAALVDFKTAMQVAPDLVPKLKMLFPSVKVGILSDAHAEEYIPKIKPWEIYFVIPKSPLFLDSETIIYVENLINPRAAFSLIRYLDQTIEMYAEVIKTRSEKNLGVEKIINHFATCGFDVHELYDVRLVLEEMLNNAFFHAFRDYNGEEKYKISSFKTLDVNEAVIIEYGSDSVNVGFSVADNAGILKPETILTKLERQYNKEGIFDENGRGLYLSRVLSNRFVVNIERSRTTQAIALFREKSLTELKPFTINYIK